MKKVNYTIVEELLEEDSFLAWYHQTDKTERNEWNEWIEQRQEHRNLANKAIRFLELMLMAKENVAITGEQVNAAFERITNTIIANERQR